MRKFVAPQDRCAALYQVDAFTSRSFRGNPAAVVLLSHGCADSELKYIQSCAITSAQSEMSAQTKWMQDVALENNLSETAFALPLRDGTWVLRWFTPSTEVDLCGHATLATSYAIWSSNSAPYSQVELRFRTRSGVLSARRDGTCSCNTA